MAVDWSTQAAWDAAYSIEVGVDLSMYANAPARGSVVHYGKWLARLLELPSQRNEPPYTEQNPAPEYLPLYHIRRARFLISRLEALGLNSTHRVLIIGSAFGYLIHAFRHAAHPKFNAASQNYPNVWGIDGSAYIANRFADEQLDLDGSTDGTTTVFRAFVNTAQVRNALTSLTGANTFHVIISEEVIESLTNAELLTFATDCESRLNSTVFRRIIHVVTPNLQDNVGFGMRSLSLDAWAALRPSHTFVSTLDGDYRLGV
jgi:hypothetical protein